MNPTQQINACTVMLAVLLATAVLIFVYWILGIPQRRWDKKHKSVLLQMQEEIELLESKVPSRCVSCGKYVKRNSMLCKKCLGKIKINTSLNLPIDEASATRKHRNSDDCADGESCQHHRCNLDNPMYHDCTPRKKK